MPVFFLLICLLALTACDEKSPVGPTVPLDQQFTRARSEAATVAGTSVSVQFVEVSGDSRCPADALCIQGGDAVVQVRVLDAGAVSAYELHTGDSARASTAHKQLRIALVQLQPYPFSSRTIAPDDYRATLQVTQR